MKKKVLLFMFLVLFCLNLGAIDWNISGAGARAAAMGGAFIGVADDATAITWNPAGLTQLYRPEVSLVARFIAENYQYDSSFYDDNVDNQSHFIVNFASAAYPLLNGRIVAAIAFQKQLDWYSGWDSDEDETAAEDPTPAPTESVEFEVVFDTDQLLIRDERGVRLARDVSEDAD